MGAHVLVVGAGLTGAGIAHYLARSAAPGTIRLTYWEKARGPGGRFSTIKSRESATIIDHGAQYITRGAGPAPDEELYDELLRDSVLMPLAPDSIAGAKPGTEALSHFVAPQGMAAVVAHLLEGKAALEYDRRARSLDAAEDSGWEVTDTAGKREKFDAVVVTVPMPQLLELEGAALAALLEPHREALARVAGRYSRRFAAMAWFEPAAWPVLRALPWASKYVKPGEAGTEGLVYVSIEPRKRGEASDDGEPALMLHSSVPFGFEHAPDGVDPDRPGVLARLLADMHRLVPGLPAPVRTKVHLWRYSQVPPPAAELRGTTGEVPGAEDGAMLLGAGSRAPLVLAGDGLVGSNFDSCLSSARGAAALLARELAPRADL